MRNRIKCFFGFHELEVKSALSRQAALCVCCHCAAKFAVKMEGENLGARIKYTDQTERFYMSPIVKAEKDVEEELVHIEEYIFHWPK